MRQFPDYGAAGAKEPAPLPPPSGGGAAGGSCGMDFAAEVVLQVPCASVDEIELPLAAGPAATAAAIDTAAIRRRVVAHAELLALAMTWTADDIDHARRTGFATAEALSALTPDEPTVVLSCGHYKIPVTRRIPVRRFTASEYVFLVPALPLGVSLAPGTPPEVLDAFEYLLREFTALEGGSSDAQSAVGAAATRALAVGAARVGAGGLTGGGASGSGAGSEYAGVPWQLFAPPRPAHSLEAAQADGLRQQLTATDYQPPVRLPGSQTSLFAIAPDLPRPPLSTRVAQGVRDVGGLVGDAATSAGSVASRGVAGLASLVTRNTRQCERPVPVPAPLLKGLGGARVVTGGVAKVSAGFAKSVVGVASFAAGKAVNVVVRRGSEAGPATGVTAHPGVQGAMEVGSAAAVAAVGVVDSAAEAVRHVLATTTEATGDVAGHTMGKDAGAAARNGVGLAYDAYQANSNVRRVGLRALAKATAKETAKQQVQQRL